MPDKLRLLLVTPNFDNNSLGRTYCLWLLARHLDWEVRTVGVRGRRVWGPVSSGDFASICEVLTDLEPAVQRTALTDAAGWADVLIAVKPLPSSLGVAAELAERTGRPLVVDVDDPDIEYRLQWQPARRRVRQRLDGRRAQLLRLRALAATLPTMVSNPVLQRAYGGIVVPHVRHVPAEPAYTDSRDIVVRIVGTLQEHTGTEVLRRSVARFAGDGVRVELTGPEPADVRSWECWLGTTSLVVGQQLVATADVIAVPSLPRSWSLGQLPAKLVDAMMMGRAVIASDVAPIRWALGGTGRLVPPADDGALFEALTELRDPPRRQELGTSAHRRALELFTVGAVAPAFAAIIREAVAGGHGLSEAVPRQP